LLAVSLYGTELIVCDALRAVERILWSRKFIDVMSVASHFVVIKWLMARKIPYRLREYFHPHLLHRPVAFLSVMINVALFLELS
jgi:hypothetical protein